MDRKALDTLIDQLPAELREEVFDYANYLLERKAPRSQGIRQANLHRGAAHEQRLRRAPKRAVLARRVRFLPDTHAFLWWDADAKQLPNSLLKTLQNPSHEIVFSVVSAWEMQIKAALGKLELRIPLATLVSEQREKNSLGVLPVSLEHVLELQNLGDYHRNPFDRLLIAQARVGGLTLVSKD